ncbi:hypothetical protein OCH239_11925 [Roseivivax halodurans JCM 10272]|uniref:Uncharacterized protein n=1 Tax=Roseivivax halodurans JCM 10272 TaxID=1449350 RepID=X7EIM8_9RHOB|nr:hypothetical protein [Roseivivax halodurans]ETX15949.1 hypothetical protein OCH239_11925 [Roseivivax halodurans JCM 10272]
MSLDETMERLMSVCELRVREGRADSLVYVFRSVKEATAMVRFLSDFLPGAEFVIQPVRH